MEQSSCFKILTFVLLTMAFAISGFNSETTTTESASTVLNVTLFNVSMNVTTDVTTEQQTTFISRSTTISTTRRGQQNDESVTAKNIDNKSKQLVGFALGLGLCIGGGILICICWHCVCTRFMGKGKVAPMDLRSIGESFKPGSGKDKKPPTLDMRQSQYRDN